ncbi:unnamed protein product [Cyprideis torosa]|uniref:Uncharacterized protein n=1 Tax=Cyprideis torosa TaxID=163714 RepID=A0A7R8ZNT8_9CRUS|nr:unnamed protein product [Cyprideis torosa]CAG0888431.1 unnamed protein product [Cyprideis torosa]
MVLTRQATTSANQVLKDGLDHHSSQSTNTSQLSASKKLIHVLDLPAEVLEKIFSYVPFAEVGEMRIVCRKFNAVGSEYLNSTFNKLQVQTGSRLREIKSQMPRRESARRKHPLARESDIIETLYMRLTLLQMSLGKHIARKTCCFFAGQILDEVFRILCYVHSTPELGKAYRVTDELFDLSTMAMEYFKEKLEPGLPKIQIFDSDFWDIPFPATAPGEMFSPITFDSCLSPKSLTSLTPLSCSTAKTTDGCAVSTRNRKKKSAVTNTATSTGGSTVGGEEFEESSSEDEEGEKLEDLDDTSSASGSTFDPFLLTPEDEDSLNPSTWPRPSMVLRNRIRKIKAGMRRYTTDLHMLQRELRSCKTKIAEQHKIIEDYTHKMADYDKKFEDSFKKFGSLLTELNKCKTELQYWRTKAPSHCISCGSHLDLSRGCLKSDAEERAALAHQGVVVPGPTFQPGNLDVRIISLLVDKNDRAIAGKERRKALKVQDEILGVTTRWNREILKIDRGVGNSNSPPQQRERQLQTPRVKVPNFSGDPMKFQEWWWNLFKVSVHDNPDLTTAEKFYHLTQCLKDEAASSIAGAGVSDAKSSYEGVNQEVKDLFGDPGQIQKEPLRSLITVFTTSLREIEQASKDLGSNACEPRCGQADLFVASLLLSKGPKDMARNWRMTTKREFDSDSLMEFLKKEVWSMVSEGGQVTPELTGDKEKGDKKYIARRATLTVQREDKSDQAKKGPPRVETLPTALVDAISGANSRPVRIFIDTGSEDTFITEETRKALGDQEHRSQVLRIRDLRGRMH